MGRRKRHDQGRRWVASLCWDSFSQNGPEEYLIWVSACVQTQMCGGVEGVMRVCKIVHTSKSGSYIEPLGLLRVVWINLPSKGIRLSDKNIRGMVRLRSIHSNNKASAHPIIHSQAKRNLVFWYRFVDCLISSGICSGIPSRTRFPLSILLRSEVILLAWTENLTKKGDIGIHICICWYSREYFYGKIDRMVRLQPWAHSGVSAINNTICVLHDPKQPTGCLDQRHELRQNWRNLISFRRNSFKLTNTQKICMPIMRNITIFVA